MKTELVKLSKKMTFQLREESGKDKLKKRSALRLLMC